MTTKSKIILGMTGAAAAGVLVGLLLAPDKGTELRKKIRHAKDDWSDFLSDFFHTTKEKMVEDKRKIKNETKKMTEEA